MLRPLPVDVQLQYKSQWLCDYQSAAAILENWVKMSDNERLTFEEMSKGIISGEITAVPADIMDSKSQQ